MKQTVPSQLRAFEVLMLWLPLAFSNLCMSLEQPVASGIIARHDNVVGNLAAFQFGFGLVLFFEGPIIFLLSTATSLVRDKVSFYAVRRFCHLIAAALSLALAALFLSGGFEAISQSVLGLSLELSARVSIVCTIMLLAPFAVGMRRFYQGCLIAQGKTKYVALSTMFRLITMAATGFLLSALLEEESLPGAGIAGAAIVSGMLAEWLLVRALVIRSLAAMPEGTYDDSLSNRNLSRFYMPLALNGLLNLSQGFVLGLFVSQSLLGETSLALWQVLMSINIVILAFPFSFQETVLSVLRKHPDAKPLLRKISSAAALLFGGSYLIAIHSPLYQYWLGHVVGMSSRLQYLAQPAFIMSAAMIGMMYLTNTERAMLISDRRTKLIGFSSICDLLSLILAMLFFVHIIGAVGLYCAALSGLLARVINLGILKSNARASPVATLNR